MLLLENITLNVNHNFRISYLSGQNLKELGEETSEVLKFSLQQLKHFSLYHLSLLRLCLEVSEPVCND